MYIVCFNGPPYSGKDTLARMVADYIDSQEVTIPTMVVSLSLPLRRIAYQMIGEVYSPATYKLFKETHYPQFGVSGRQLMIDASEKFLKLCYGKEIMADMLLSELQNFDGVALIADSGFQCEIDPLVNEVGRGNLFVAQMRRDTCTFKGDSREWVTHNHMCEIHNNGTLNDLRQDAANLYKVFVSQMGWKF